MFTAVRTCMKGISRLFFVTRVNENARAWILLKREGGTTISYLVPGLSLIHI